MLASVTRRRVRSLRFAPAFLWKTFLAERQVVRATGFLGGRLLIDRGLTFWTLSMRESEPAMKAFRGSGPHLGVMPRLAEWCDEAAYAHWSPANGSVPTWPEAHDRLLAEGCLSRVTQPPPKHEARYFAKPRLSPRIGQNLKPNRGIAVMRGAATCNIHDNLPALEAVRHHIRQSGADHVVVGGELASGPTTPETFTAFTGKQDFSAVHPR